MGVVAVGALVLVRLRPGSFPRMVAAAHTVVTLLAGPALWSFSTSFAGSPLPSGAVMATAGPNPMAAMFAGPARAPGRRRCSHG